MATSGKGNKPTRQDGARDPEIVGRRDLLKIATGLGALGVAGAAPTLSEAAEPGWDYEADIVVCGAGAGGLAAAIRAHDQGDRALVVDQNFEPGGKMIHSDGRVSLGGNDPLQARDIKGASDPEGFVTVRPLHKPEALRDDPDRFFTELTDWSVLDTGGYTAYRYNEPDYERAFVDNAPRVAQFLMDNYVRFGRVNGSMPGHGVARGRAAPVFLKLGDKTDIKAGTVSRADAGERLVRASPFAPCAMTPQDLVAGPNTVGNGAAVARPLEFSAREKGVQFILHRHMDELIRAPDGRVLGIQASYSPRRDPDTGQLLQSLWTKGNVQEERKVIRIRARKGVLIATGGFSSNPEFRGMFYPAMRDPAVAGSALAILGPRGQDASGILAGMKVGAGLAGMQQNLANPVTFSIPSRLATRDSFSSELPGHPGFSFRKSTGIALGSSSYEHLIAVNQVGKRFFNELDLTKTIGRSMYPGGPDAGIPKMAADYQPGDWRNSDPQWVRQMYARHSGVDAAMQINEGSVAPDYFAGMHWAIFDQGTLDREGWDIRAPFTHSDNGCFFSADTIEELAAKIQTGNTYQRKVQLKYLAQTVRDWNAAIEANSDDEFDRGKDAPRHKIEKPKFYAASIQVVWHDPYGGLRVNGKSQVLDLEGKVIPGLYSAGESSGGSNQHGLGRAFVQGYLAADNIHDVASHGRA